MDLEKMTPAQLRKMADELEIIQKFIEFAREVRDKVARGDYHDDDDYDHWAFELIMKEVLGKDYFTWHNSMIK